MNVMHRSGLGLSSFYRFPNFSQNKTAQADSQKTPPFTPEEDHVEQVVGPDETTSFRSEYSAPPHANQEDTQETYPECPALYGALVYWVQSELNGKNGVVCNVAYDTVATAQKEGLQHISFEGLFGLESLPPVSAGALSVTTPHGRTIYKPANSEGPFWDPNETFQPLHHTPTNNTVDWPLAMHLPEEEESPELRAFMEKEEAWEKLVQSLGIWTESYDFAADAVCEAMRNGHNKVSFASYDIDERYYPPIPPCVFYVTGVDRVKYQRDPVTSTFPFERTQPEVNVTTESTGSADQNKSTVDFRPTKRAASELLSPEPASKKQKGIDSSNRQQPTEKSASLRLDLKAWEKELRQQQLWSRDCLSAAASLLGCVDTGKDTVSFYHLEELTALPPKPAQITFIRPKDVDYVLDSKTGYFMRQKQ